MPEQLRPRRADRGEEGIALVVTMVVITIVMMLTIGMLATGVHLDQATARDRRYNLALQVAEAGVDQAAYQLKLASTYPGTGVNAVDVPGGQYEVVTSSPARGYVVVTSTGHVPSRSATNAVRRRVRVTFGPSKSFEFALFSETSLELKNNGATTGDVWANESLVMDNNTTLKGSVTSARGTVSLGSNARVEKNGSEGGAIYSGGFDAGGSWGIELSNNAVAEGSANARAETCPGTAADNSRYNISNNGTIEGNATARGSINGTVNGIKTPFNCQPREPDRQLPTFTYDASLYPSPVEYTTVASFQAWVSANSSALTGTRRVWVDACASDPSGGSSVLDLGGTTITGEFTLITNCRIDFNNNADYSGSPDTQVSIISLNTSSSPPSIDIKNNFDIPDPAPAVLLYTTGLIQVKNDTESNGAVFSGAISIKNNLDVTYDPRVERTLGFGPVRYERISYEEISPN
ncbi:MAG: hypothetical protein H0U26_04800 [Acidimicrobiia bacterium]|nr:hypothetical protein [Acidimicrobiia bacterium]